ncbi:D-glycero-beta-D-manno-heptose-7-phosphate kinase [Desulfogranum mediterraneum]|uniref:D-glycero-beta-D-manno-heptose-7-phosphate kinase n=1 Tax=Desulfogranum mediterraneum TaxID=160661 RepID=UPI0005547947|nr:D-glycero-beta-D-manno-heptose-7-phosphate kinase [Desulfogranum mediterraneum]
MSTHSLHDLVARFSGKRVLVIGDIIVDHFVWGSVTRISPEAPVPVVNVNQEELLLGGSANVLRNLISLGGGGSLSGLIGSDAMGRQIIELVDELGASSAGIVCGRRPTTVKTRVIAQGQQVVRFDREQTGEPSAETFAALVAYLEEHLQSFDAVMVSDYAKGVINDQFMVQLRRLLARCEAETGKKLPLIVDPKPSNMHCFVGATVITPNHLEATQMSGIQIHDEHTLLAAAHQILEDIGCEAVLITRGEAGMALLQSGQPMITIPTMAKEVYDVTGAGDTVAATMALGLAAGCSMEQAAELANHAAGIVVGKVGTACVNGAELLETLPPAC